MLIEAWAGCLTDADDEEEDNAARGRHALIMRRFRRILVEQPDRALYIPELCEAIEVSERTFRICCSEQIGMSPKRYLTLRRMHLVRRALLIATLSAGSVTEIATRYGFWEFGRFAAVYRSIFDELPSETLRRAH